MYGTILPPGFHHALNDSNTSYSLSDVHHTSKIGGPPSEADSLCGPMEPIPTTRCSSQDSNPSNVLADWGAVAPWTLGVTSPFYQEVLEGTGVLDAALTTHASYSDTYFHHSSLPSIHGVVRSDMIQPEVPYPLGQVANTGADNGSLSVSEAMEHQSIPEMTYMNGSPSMPSSALERCALTAWSGLVHVTDHDDHCPLGLASNPTGHVSSRESVMGTPEDAKIARGTSIAEVPQSVVCETNPVKAPLLPLLVPVKWRKIPQRRYTSRTGDMTFLQSQRIPFSVNGVPGFNMQRALDQVFVGLDKRDDPVLENANGPASCRLLFPGYPMNTRSNQIAVRNWKKDPAPIPKSKLSYEVAKRVRQYLDELVAIPIDQFADPQWTVGQGWMKLEKMYLVSISWVSKGSLQPEIWVDTGDA